MEKKQASGGLSLSERIKALKRKVGEGVEGQVNAEEAKKRKMEAIKRRKAQERKELKLAEERERNKTGAEREADAVLQAVKDGVIEWKVRKVSLTKELARTTNYKNWVVDAGSDGKFVVRDLQDKGSALRDQYHFDQDREYAFQAAAGRSGLGFLTPHHLKAHGGIILHRYHPTASAMTRDAVMAQNRSVATFLKSLHTMETVGLTRFLPWNVFTEIDDLCASINEKVEGLKPKQKPLPDDGEGAGPETKPDASEANQVSVLPESFSNLRVILAQWRDLISEHHPDDLSKSYVCHNNLKHSKFFNIPPMGNDPLDRDGKIVCVDFETAALGDRYYDIATFFRLNNFTKDEEVVFMAMYFGSFSERQMACVRMLEHVGCFRDALSRTLAYLITSPSPGSAPATCDPGFASFQEAVEDPEFVSYVSSHFIQ